MMKIRLLMLLSMALLLTACASNMGFGSREFVPEIQIHEAWHSDIGQGQSGLTPVIVDNRIFALSADGYITSINKNNGAILWRQQISTKLLAGFVESNGMLFAFTTTGKLIAIDEKNGKIVWQKIINAATNTNFNFIPKLAADSSFVVITLPNGNLACFSITDGSPIWTFNPAGNASITSEPMMNNQLIMVGLSDGTITAIQFNSGLSTWTKQIAQNNPVDQIAIYSNTIYASSSDGSLSAFSLPDTNLVFKHQVTGAQGLAADASQLYFADNQGFLWGFDNSLGIAYWKENHFSHHHISAPVLFGNYVIVADSNGYLYWMDKNDGHLVGQNRFDSSGFSTNPISSDSLLFVYSNDGTLFAFRYSIIHSSQNTTET